MNSESGEPSVDYNLPQDPIWPLLLPPTPHSLQVFPASFTTTKYSY